MIDATTESPGALPLEDLGALRVRGADAVKFLQGQLSNDLAQLSRERSLLAGLHNPQGRTVALLRLAWLADDDLLALLPRELVEPVIARLRKYVLRAKVALANESEAWRVWGVEGAAPRERPGGRAVAIEIAPRGWWWARNTGSVDDASPPTAARTLTRAQWRLADIRAGLPQVYAATSEAFVAQMLNLDCVGGISFEKGCYTGQEIIARAHYRGRMKRRMQRFLARTAVELSPGVEGRFADGRSFTVVEAERTPEGAIEFLAVTTMSAAAPETARGQAEEERAAGPAASTALAAEPLPLPYLLPA